MVVGDQSHVITHKENKRSAQGNGINGPNI